jgi:hypothetical protein
MKSVFARFQMDNRTFRIFTSASEPRLTTENLFEKFVSELELFVKGECRKEHFTDDMVREMADKLKRFYEDGGR